MKGKKVVRVKKLEGTPYFISEDEKLGKGTYSEVYRAYNRESPNEQLVVKIINLHETDNKEAIQTQLEMIRELPRHENLVNCVKAHIQSQNNLYIIMQYCNQGSLQTFIHKMTLLPQQRIWEIVIQICKGYQVLYDSHLLHRDIKPDNILIHNKVFKLADFGLSKRIKDHSLNQNLSYAGSPLYIAPQIVDKHEGTSKIDVFSLGSVLYELAYDGTQPFVKEGQKFPNTFEYYERRKKMKLVLKPKNKKGELRSEELRHLISRMLQFNEDYRISWDEIFKHPKIDIDSLKTMPSLDRFISEEEHEIEDLKNSMIEVRKSSAKMQPIVEKDNVREQSEHLALELISFEQILEHSELRTLENEMLRLKITSLTIFYCNNKINYLVRGNQKCRQLHKHIIQCLQMIVIEGLLFLLKINHLLTLKIKGYEQHLMKDLKQILQKDKTMLADQFRKEAVLFKHFQLQRELQGVERYNLRRYENELYTVLTEYMDFPVQAKQKVGVVVALLIDVYDSSLKLADMVKEDSVKWQKYQDINEIQTKMDQFCMSKREPYEFHTYLVKKQHVRITDNLTTLKKLGLLFE